MKKLYAYKGHFIRRDDTGMWELILKPGFSFEGYGDATHGSHISFSDTRAEAKAEVNERAISECRCPTCTDPETKTHHDQLLRGERK